MITKFKLYENNSSYLFKNESKIKELLSTDEDFQKGDVHQALLNIIHDEWKNHKDWGYDKILEWTSNNFGRMPLFAMYLAKYCYQVDNGGHYQYYDNGFASSVSKGCGSNYSDTDKHEKFVNLFQELELDEILPSGKDALRVISKFDYDLITGGNDSSYDRSYNYGYDDEEEEEEEEEIDNSQLQELDEQWYDINDKVMEDFNDYLKRLTLDGELINNLIKKVDHLPDSKKFNL